MQGMQLGVALGVLTALAIVLRAWASRSDRRRREQLVPLVQTPGASPYWSRWRMVGACWLLGAAALLLSLTAAPSASTIDGAVVLAVDVSRSMLTPDVEPDRLSASLEILQQGVRSQRGRTFGVVAFAADGMAACPMTPDTQAVTAALSMLARRPIVGKTSITNGLRTAAEMLKAVPGGGTIVLVSDGEDFGEPVDDVISELRAANIAVIAVGAGTETGGIVPSPTVTDTAAVDAGGPSRLDVNFLSRLATNTGGAYLPLGDARLDPGRVLTTRSAPASESSLIRAFGLAAVALAALILVVETLLEMGSRKRVQP